MDANQTIITLEPGEAQTIIVVEPGEIYTITIRAAELHVPDPLPPVPEPPPALNPLPVPYLPQWGTGANRSRGDCGPAALTMAIHYLTDQQPSVDQVSKACGQPTGSLYANFRQIEIGARAYGLQPAYVRPLTMARIEAEIDAGFPVLALGKYDVLPKNQDKFKGPHFVLVIGYTAETIIFHDSNRLRGKTFGASREVDRGIFDRFQRARTSGNMHILQGMTLNV